MSEKRFSQRLGGEYVYLTHIYDNGEEMMLDEIVDLLNEWEVKIWRLNKKLLLMDYQLKVQDRILKELGE